MARGVCQRFSDRSACVPLYSGQSRAAECDGRNGSEAASHYDEVRGGRCARNSAEAGLFSRPMFNRLKL